MEDFAGSLVEVDSNPCRAPIPPAVRLLDAATKLSQKITARSILSDRFIGPMIAMVLVLLTGFGLVLVVMPLFARSFGVGNDGAGLLIAAFGFARLFGDLIGGSIVDRKGERWTAVVGMAYLAACVLATASAPNFPLAVAFWALAGIGSAVVFASLFSYILKAAPEDSVARTMSFFFGAFNIGVILGGTAGGFLAEAFGLAAPLYAYGIVLLVAIPGYLRFVASIPDSQPKEEVIATAEAEAATAGAPLPSQGIIRGLIKVPGFLTALFLNLTYLWVVATVFQTLLPLFANQELDMSPGGIGAVFSLSVAAEFFVLFPAGTLADRHGRRTVMLPALVGLTLMIVLLGASTSPLMLALLLAVLSLFSGFAGVPPAAILSDVVPKQHSGRGVGAFRFAGDIGFFLGPLIVGAASKAFGFQWAFVIAACIPALAILVTLRMRETLRSRASSPDGTLPEGSRPS